MAVYSDSPAGVLQSPPLPRKLGEAKTRNEARRCLKRRLSDMVYRQLVADAQEDRQVAGEAGPGGHSGATSRSSAADLNTPVIGSSGQPQPGTRNTTPPAQNTSCADQCGLGSTASALTATSGDAHSQGTSPGC
jgi:hypothetical protein